MGVFIYTNCVDLQTVDIGLGPFSVTHSRSKVVDFSVGFYEDGNAILIPPPAVENRLLACTKPFRLETWLTLMLFATILPVILWQHSEFYWIHYRDKCPTLGNKYFVILGVLIGQCILMSFLRFPKLLPVINQLEELPGSHLKWVVLRGTALDSLFLDASSGVYKTIGGIVIYQRGALIDVHLDGVHLVASGGYAYIAGKSNLESSLYEDYTRTGKCRLSIAKQEFFKINVAFAFSKNSPLKAFMDEKYNFENEAGLVIYWKKIYGAAPTGGKCGKVKQSDTGPKSLSLTDFQGAFIILIIGFGLTSLVFLFEQFPFIYRSLCRLSFFNNCRGTSAI
uniref:Uncharacterized protein n=1 Tax=Daphnia galeata TaxID=27404 RepID=A0A8J2RMH7_9CRUS|nr:unnamed protein product [Daphnia galeata]